MSRKKKLLLNTGTGLLKQLITVICGFILPRYMLMYFGSSLNGLVSSISYFLGFISLLDMGVGSVVQANLYKPLADNDTVQISKVLKSSDRFFRRLAYIFLGYIAVLFFIYPTVINDDYGFIFTASLIIIISISTFAQYYFGITYQLLLNADQKAYVQTLMQIATVVLNTIICIVLMNLGCNIHVVKLASAAIYVLRPIGQNLYVRKHYCIDKNIVLTEEPIKQKWNGFSQHVASTVCTYADVVILTLFSTLENVSVYSVYYLVTNGITQVVLTGATGIESMFGNMIANNEKSTLNRSFVSIEFLIHALITFLYTVAIITIIPFVRVYTSGINDANYIVPLFGATLVLAYGAECLRIPYFRIIKAAGHFKQTQNGAYISAILNIVISVTLVYKFGLVGVAVGTLVAMLYHTVYFAWYLRKNIINRPFWHFIKHMIVDVVIGGLGIIATLWLEMSEVTYVSWVIYAFAVAIIVGIIVIVINVLVYRSEVSYLWNRFVKRK